MFKNTFENKNIIYGTRNILYTFRILKQRLK